MEDPKLVNGILVGSIAGIVTMAIVFSVDQGPLAGFAGFVAGVGVFWIVRRRRRGMKPDFRSPKPPNSFTLLELLIVVGIIGLLAGLLFPVLGKVRERGWQTRCLSNLHQLGIAVNLYAQDHRQYLPVAAMQPTVNTNLPAIVELLAPHVGQQQSKVFQCPADRQPLDVGQTFFELEGCSYSWNSLLNGRLIDRTQIDIAAMKLWPPIMGDYEKFHGGSDSGRNYLYPDGRVENDLKSLIQ